MTSFTRYESEHFYVDTNKKQHRFPSLADKPTLTLSVIVPAKDEEKRLPAMLDDCLKHLQQRQDRDDKFTYEVIVVDDGSTDGTLKVVDKYAKQWSSEKLRALKLERNRGKGGAVRLGVLCARGRYILFADADGATTFSCVDKLQTRAVEVAPTNNNSKPDPPVVVCGSRAHLEKDSMATRSLARTILMLGFHFLVWLFCVRSIHDTQCGFKLFSRSAARRIFPNMHIERWAFDVELLYIAEYLHIPCAEVSVEWREIDGSKITPVWSWLQMGRDLLLIWFKYLVGIWKIDDNKKVE